MTVLGPAIIDRRQQENIRKRGHKNLILHCESVFPDAAERAQVGDLWWVKEPHFDVRSGADCPEIHEIVPGYGPYRYAIPAPLKGYTHLCRWREQPTKQMRRGDSLMTLEITEPVTGKDSGWLCRVILQSVDAMLKEKAA